MNFNITQFSADISAKTGGRTLRDIADESGVSAPTLHRLLAGKMPDLLTYAKICQWLGVNMNRYFEASYQDKHAAILHEIVAKVAFLENNIPPGIAAYDGPGNKWAEAMHRQIQGNR